jgi:hypothetical protein
MARRDQSICERFSNVRRGKKKAGSKNHHTRRIASACLPEKTGAKALCLFMLRGTAKAVP